MYHQYREGWLEVICGCMFAGKTEELIRRINVLSYAKKNILAFKPKIDNRYSDSEIVSHAGAKVPCYAIDNAKEILKKVISLTNKVVALKRSMGSQHEFDIKLNEELYPIELELDSLVNRLYLI